MIIGHRAEAMNWEQRVRGECGAEAERKRRVPGRPQDFIQKAEGTIKGAQGGLTAAF